MIFVPKSRLFFRPVAAAVGLTLTAFLLAGCGAVNSAINARIQPAANLLGLDNQTVDVIIGNPSTGVREIGFSDRSLPEAGRLRFVRFDQSFQNTVTVSVPSGTALPAQFSLSSVTLTLAVRDEAPRQISVSRTRSDVVTFVRVGDTNQYQTSETLVFSGLEIRNDFGTFRDIFMNPPAPNNAGITLGLETASLPSGAVVRFTLINGSARFGV